MYDCVFHVHVCICVLPFAGWLSIEETDAGSEQQLLPMLNGKHVVV